MTSAEFHAEMIDAMRAHARYAHPVEACGLLAVDRAGKVRFVYALTNTADSEVRFVIDPVEHFGALRHAERQGWDIGGVFHSHPAGLAVPSPIDIAEAGDPTWLQVIVGEDGVAAFRFRGRRSERLRLSVASPT